MSPARLAAWGAALALLFVPLGRAPAPSAAGSLASRVLGPVGSLAASLQWLRVEQALDHGRPTLAFARAETALELDPESSEGWIYLARILAHRLGSPEVEAEPAARARWVRAALEVLRRGEEQARRPSELLFARALILIQVGLTEEGLIPWPGGGAGALREAAGALAQAAALGHPEAEELERATRAAAGRSE